jgi:hypothetical protein
MRRLRRFRYRWIHLRLPSYIIHSSSSIPTPSNNRPRRIPRPMDLILIPLQPNQPPARRAHTQKRSKAAHNHSQDGMPQPAARDNHHPRPPDANTIKKIVSVRCRGQEWCFRCRRKTGKRPKTSMLKRVRLKTWFVDGRREARTVLAMRAAFVDSEAGNLELLVRWLYYRNVIVVLTLLLVRRRNQM